MKRLPLLLLLLLAIPGSAAAIGVQGNVSKAGGLGVYPCDIDIVDRQSGLPVVIAGDTTLVNGDYNLPLPNGRYDITFKPKLGSHLFYGFVVDARVNNNTLVFNLFLPAGKYVTGRVLGPDNVGVNFTNIRFRTAAGAAPTNVQNNNTNPDGTFTALVDAGTWNIGIIPATAMHRAPIELVGMDITGDLALGDIHVPEGFIVTCSVTDSNLFPVAGGPITVRKAPGRTKLFVPTNNVNSAGIAQVVVPAGGYDFIAEPPLALQTTYATKSQYSVVVGADMTLPNFVLPPGRQLSAHVVGGPALTTIVNADIDVDWQQAPVFPRVETPNDFTNITGDFSVTVGTGTYRVTINPPVATKCLSKRIENVSVGATNLSLGTIACAAGHWLDVTVIDPGTGLPVPGANLDLRNVATGILLVTIGDVTNASGFARIVTDQELYTLKVVPPNATYDTTYVTGVRTLNDTTLTVFMPKTGTLGVGDRGLASLHMAAPWPNPARDGVNFSFSGRGEGALEILDLAGRRVATPWQGTLAGEATARWDGRDTAGREVPGGVYFARLRTGSETRLRRIVRVK